MSDVWHTTDIIPEEDRIIVVKSKRTGEYLVGIEFEFNLDNFSKWAYFDDLLALETKLDCTRKALDVAVESLNDIANLDDGSTVYNSEKFLWTRAYAKSALEQITALEQKE